MRRTQALVVCVIAVYVCKNAQQSGRRDGTLSGMNPNLIAAKLAKLPSKRTFCKRHGLPPRTLWRIIAGDGNPTVKTLQAFASALRKDARKVA